MEQVPSICSAISGLIILLILFLSLLNKVKFATGLAIFHLSLSPLVAGLIYLYAFPANKVQGDVLPVIPFSIGALLALTSLALLTSIIPNRSTAQNLEPKFTRWILLAGGCFLHFIGIAVTLTLWYNPQSFGNQEPSALNGVISYNIFILFSAVLMYIASRKNSYNRPNLMRKIVTLVIVLWVSQTTVLLSVILIYAFPSKPVMSYPNEAALNFLASIIWGTLLLFMNKEVINIKNS